MKTGQVVIKNTSALLLGRLLSMVLSVFYIAALARYVHATGMGIIATAMSVISMTSLIINFGLNDLATRDIAADKSRAAVYVPTIVAIRGILILVFLAIIILITKLANYSTEILVVVFIYAFAYGIDAFSDICLTVFNANEKMEYSATIQTGRDLINITLSLLAIALRTDLAVIVGVSAFANVLKLMLCWGMVRWKFVKTLNPADLSLGKQLIIASLPFAAISIFNVLSGQGDTFILSLYWATDEVGWYSSAKFLIGYLLLIPTVFFQAIFPVFSKLNATSKEDLRKTYTASFKYLLLLGFALFAGTVVTADSVISLVYGPGFEKTTAPLVIMSASFFWMFGYANGGLLITTGKQNLVTIFSATAMVMNIAVSLLLIPKMGLLGASLAHILPGAIFFMPLVWICHKWLDLKIPYLLGFKAILASLFMAVAVALTLDFHIHVLVAVLVVAPLVYSGFLAAFGVLGRKDVEFVFEFLRKKLSRGKSDEIPVHGN